MTRKNISIKNYFYLALIVLITLGVIYYLYLWFDEYRKEVRNISELSKYLQVINYNELNNIIIENDEVCIYVGDSDKKNFDFERKLKELIMQNNLRNDIIYLDVSNHNNNGNFVINDIEFKQVPMFLIFNDGKITSSYDITQNDFNIDKISSYLNSVGVLKYD